MMRTLVRSVCISLLVSLAFCAVSQALSYNNVRVDKFKWMHAQTEHFDVYYDESNKDLAPRFAHYLEAAWKDVGKKLNYFVPERSPFFVFANHNEFEQTNIVSIGEGTGGVAEPAKNRFMAFNDGSEAWIRHVTSHEFTHIVEFNILFGGFWKSARLLKSPFYPLWVMEGLAEFASGDVDESVGDMVIRDAVANKKLPALPELQGFGHLEPNQVTLGYKTGEAALAFLEDEFGLDKVQRMIPMLKDYFDVSSLLEELVGCDLYRFDFRFHEWLEEKYDEFFKTAKDPAFYGPKITSSDLLPQSNRSPVLTKDAKKMYFFSDRAGLTQIFERDMTTSESKLLVKLQWTQFENLHPRGRGLSLSRDGRWLAFAGEKKQRDFLFLYDLKRKKLKKIKVPFDEFRSPVFSPVDDTLVGVGMTNGFNDLYLINQKGQVLKRLTDNPQDERDPVFADDGEKVVYSGEVMKADGSEPAGRDLFEVDVEGKNINRLTNGPGHGIEPEFLPDGSLVYVRDRNEQGQLGFNLYHWTSSTTAPRQLTNFIGGGFSPRYSESDQSLYYVAFFKGEHHVYKSTSVLTISRPEVEAPTDETESDSVMGDPPLKKGVEPTQVMHSWFNENDSSLLFSGARPYRFYASTDFFLPLFLYSTVDGLIFTDILQASEMLGNHRLQQQMLYGSKNDILNLTVLYTYARFRPEFTIGFRTLRFDSLDGLILQRKHREANGIGLMTYPLDRVNAVDVGVGVSDEKDVFFDDEEEDTNTQDRYWTTGFSHDTVTGRYLIPTWGRAFNVLFRQGQTEFGGDQRYNTGIAQWVQYFPLPRESTFRSRFFYGRSVGRNAQVFRLGGADRIRTLSSSSLSNKKTNAFISNHELRWRVRYLNARTKYLFPDFFFKAMYIILSDDAGVGWDSRAERKDIQLNDIENTTGLGVSWPTFVLQTFRLDFTVQWAHNTTNGSDVWYITIGSVGFDGF